MKKLEKWIPGALVAVQNHLVRDGSIPKEYKGYVSSFGASVIQSGLLPSVIFFSDSNTSSNEDRNNLMKAIFHLIREKNPAIREHDLLQYVLHNQNNESLVKETILTAAIAIKLAMRTFKINN